MSVRFFQIVVLCLVLAALPARAQQSPPVNGQPMDMPMDMSMETPGWHFMQDAVVFGTFNHQGGPIGRGGNEFKATNWWMGMFSRKAGKSDLTLNAMFSLDPATVGKDGYREIFQTGESLDGHPLVDRQHPHDLFMQLAAVWQLPLTDRTSLTLAGGPVAEPAIGPVAFMHRASSSENPMAPLSHHTFDSTHAAFGVVSGAVRHGPWTIEASAFNGREPDEERWDFDFGALDSFAGRIWFKPAPEWEFQASSARLTHPELLDQRNVTRTTASAAWFAQRGNDFSAVTAGVGLNATDGANRYAAFVEGTHHRARSSLFARFELVDVETYQLLYSERALFTQPLHEDPVAALTVGGVHDVLRVRGFEGGIGAGVTFYGVPDSLSSSYGNHPVSFQVFFRLRPPAGAMGRMFNMRMVDPRKGMSHDGMAHP